jgi:hypothetical protein
LLGLSLASALLVSGASMSTLRSAVPRQQADETSFVVGVTSWNGSIEVLGRFDGMRWVNTWPEVDEPSRPVPPLADMPTAWLGKPVPREWRVWMRGQDSFPRLVTHARRGLGQGEVVSNRSCW